MRSSGSSCSASPGPGRAWRCSAPNRSLNLGLAQQGQAADALAHFAEAARLKPDFAEDRFNHGVALAKAGRFAEAAREFQETLRLDPANDRAARQGLPLLPARYKPPREL